MIFLDTNVLIYAFDTGSAHCDWARQMVADGVSGDGAAINAVALAEICVGDEEPDTVAERMRSWGVDILDVPAAAADVCAKAYRRYLDRRVSQSDRRVSRTPLPDFFIGAHAQIMSWDLVTADKGRFRTYFPKVRLRTPE